MQQKIPWGPKYWLGLIFKQFLIDPRLEKLKYCGPVSVVSAVRLCASAKAGDNSNAWPHVVHKVKQHNQRSHFADQKETFFYRTSVLEVLRAVISASWEGWIKQRSCFLFPSFAQVLIKIAFAVKVTVIREASVCLKLAGSSGSSQSPNQRWIWQVNRQHLVI